MKRPRDDDSVGGDGEDILFGDQEDSKELEGYQPRRHRDDLEDDENDLAKSEEEGDDLMEDMDADYDERPELDHYENAGIDDEDADELSAQARMEVDQRLDRQDRIRAMQG